MKKILFILLAVNFLFASVGKFVLVRGDVEIIRDGQKIKAKSGMDIENKDKINTLGIAKAQIKFDDDTIVSLGKNTSFVINDYLYASNESKVDIGVDAGSFKVISGEVGKLARDNFKFKANTATVGIRGTIFAGEVGLKNKKDIIACVQGGIVVKIGDLSREVNAGKMVEVNKGQISKPIAINSKQIETINSLDSNKINDDVSDKNSNNGYNIKKSNIDVVKSDRVDYFKQNVENTSSKKEYYTQKEYGKYDNPYYKNPYHNSSNNPNGIIDRANGVFYYLGTYQNNSTSYDNAHAKVNYNVSSADFYLKSDPRYGGLTYTGLSKVNGGEKEVFKGMGGASGAILKIDSNKENVEFYHRGHNYQGDLISNPTDRW